MNCAPLPGRIFDMLKCGLEVIVRIRSYFHLDESDRTCQGIHARMHLL